jgi:nitrate reductase NapE component
MVELQAVLVILLLPKHPVLSVCLLGMFGAL